MALKQPPYVNGLCDFARELLDDGTANPAYDAAKVKDVTDKLNAIKSAFDPTDDQPVCDTFYLTATYNLQNADAPINGDTCDYLLAPVGEGNGTSE